MKKLLLILLTFSLGCTTPHYVYIVDDVYYGRPLQGPLNNMSHSRVKPNVINLPPYNHWRQYPNQKRLQRTVPKLYLAPRKENLESFAPQVLPPPPPSDKKEEEKGDVKKQAPVRRFDNIKR